MALAKRTDFAPVCAPVTDREAANQFAHPVGRSRVIEDVEQKVDLPRISMAKISLADRSPWALAEEPEHFLELPGQATGVVIGEFPKMIGGRELESQGHLVPIGGDESAPKTDENKGRDVEQARLIALDEGQDFDFPKATVRAFARPGIGGFWPQGVRQDAGPERSVGTRTAGIREKGSKRMLGGRLQGEPTKEPRPDPQGSPAKINEEEQLRRIIRQREFPQQFGNAGQVLSNKPRFSNRRIHGAPPLTESLFESLLSVTSTAETKTSSSYSLSNVGLTAWT